MGDEVSVSALPLVVRLGGSCLSPLVSVLKKGKNIEVCQQNHLTTVKKVNFESDTRMPIVRPPRDLSKVKSVKKYKTRNGEIVHELVVLFDYVRHFKNNLIFVRSPFDLSLFDLSFNQKAAGLSEPVLQGLKEIFLKFDTDKASAPFMYNFGRVHTDVGFGIKCQQTSNRLILVFQRMEF